MGQKKNPLLTLVLVVVVIAGLSLCYMQFNDYRFEKNRLVQEEQLLLVTQTRLAAVQNLSKQRGQLEADLELLAQRLPDSAEEDQLLVDLQSGADLAHMDFAQIRFTERVPSEGYIEMPIQALFNGTYHEVLHFLDYLQVYERTLRIDELRLDEGDDEMTISLRASAFYATE